MIMEKNSENKATIVKYGIVEGIDTEIIKKNVEVIETYKSKTYFIRILRLLKKKFHFLNVNFIYNEELKKISSDYIIVFDSEDLKSDVEFLRKKHPKKKIIVWYRNPVSKSALPDSVKGANEIWSYSKEESKQYGLKYHVPFYIAEVPLCNDSEKKDVFFVGIDKGRYDWIMKYKEIMEQQNISTDFYSVPDHDYQIHDKMEYSKALPYYEILKKIQNSNCILDLYMDPYTGLSFRPLEALYFEKKLITNHELIIEEPFYDKNNIFLLGRDSLDDLKEFVSSHYKKIDSEIVLKYSFEKWISDLTS